ncbi:MAG TPA: RIP metalloprotease RseP [Hanamia sp.]|nr:RIP metalloprotease RseP [Hanamia sp.]
MTLLAINWPGVGLQAGYLVFSLSILVIVHEFGHFVTAKWFKCRVEKFYLFFDPWFSVFKKKVGETEYGVGWLPLGGYVKISGMVDESMDKEQIKQPPQPWEFRSKPAWQRLIILLAGVTMNVLLAFVIYAMVLYTWGESKLPMQDMKNGIWITDSLMSNIGLKNGDKIMAVNGEPVKYFEDLPGKILVGKTITVERNGNQENIDVPVNMIEQLIEQKGKRNTHFFQPRLPVIIGEFPGSKSKSSGNETVYVDARIKNSNTGTINDSINENRKRLRVYDKIVAVDSTPVNYFDEMAPLLKKKKGDSVTLTVIRDGSPVKTRVLVDTSGTIGFYNISFLQADSLGLLKIENKKYGFLASFPAGVRETGKQLDFYIQQIKMILNPETGAYKGLGGFKTMASIFPSTGWDWQVFWKITAFFSIILAFMNLLPIPALDGGHVVFTVVEMITGRKPSDKFLEYAQIVGMVILFALLIYANGNDWFGWGRGH